MTTVDRLRARALLSLPGVKRASYAGQCDGCGSRFHVGDPIKRDGYGWVAGCCIGEDRP